MTRKRTSSSKRLRLEVLSVLRSAETGVRGAVIWIAAGEFDNAGRHLGPRLLLVRGDEIRSDRLTDALPVLLASRRDILGVLPPGVAGEVESFVAKNRDALLRHWNGETDTREMLDSLVRA
jgi:hypothetical protein